MLPSALIFQIFTTVCNCILLIFIAYYFLNLKSREKSLEKKETQIDTDYHQIVDNALTKERKILEDATTEADHIITNTQYVSQASKESVDQSLQQMEITIQKDALDTAQDFTKTYQTSLKQLATQSLNDFQTATKNLETDYQNQIKDFHQNILPTLKKELEEYKQVRLKETEQLTKTIVQKASQEILNKALSLEDHHTLLTQALEKAKKEGLFE
jgi:hypothetical protein